MRQRVLGVLAAIGIAFAAIIVTATPASAGVADCNLRSYVKMTGGAACFEPYGDHWWVDDTKADGHGVKLVFLTSYGRQDSCYQGGGAGSGWKDCNFNVKENETIQGYVEVNGEWSGWGPWVNT